MNDPPKMVHRSTLEIWCDDREDEGKIVSYLMSHKEIL